MEESETKIRLPPYGYVSVSSREQDVIDTEPVQRLHWIRQLGMSYTAYPSAAHTRFEHSLGTMHIAGRLAESVGLDEAQVAEARIAGLLHDTGHGPFSHASELFIDDSNTTTGVPHEELSCAVVDELADKLPANPERVKDYITGDADVNIIAGTVDADRLDYLRRDSYMTGVEHGTIDAETIIRSATLVDGDLAFEETALHSLEEFLTARFQMIRSVYNHHTPAIAEAMLQRALSHYVRENGLASLQSKDDGLMHAALLNGDGVAHDLYNRIYTRDLYKRATVLTEQDISRDELKTLEAVVDPQGLERAIASKADIPTEHVLVDLPSLPSPKPMDVTLVDEEGETHSFAEVSPVPEMLNELEWRGVTMSVYVAEEHRDAVSDVSEQLLYDVLDEA